MTLQRTVVYGVSLNVITKLNTFIFNIYDYYYSLNYVILLIYYLRVGHHNELISAMSNPPTYARRLKRQWTSDLFFPQETD